jgi:hypothetical protein
MPIQNSELKLFKMWFPDSMKDSSFLWLTVKTPLSWMTSLTFCPFPKPSMISLWLNKKILKIIRPNKL